MPIRSFGDRGTRDVFDDTASKRARKTCPVGLWNRARRKLDQLDKASDLNDLRASPGNRLEKLAGDRRGQHSIRINQQYRICFRWTRHGPENVEITDYHRR